MKSALRLARNQGKPPVAMGGFSRGLRGHGFNLGVGRQDRETMMRQYSQSGTVFGITSLLANATATPTWRLYKKQPVDGRRRYTTADQRVDQRVEVVQHAAIKLWNAPNSFHSGFEFREGSQLHQELTGETFWVLDMEVGFPTGMWYVRPDRMEPVPDPDDYLVGWIYTGPDGSATPLRNDEVILEKLPDPLDPYRGLGPVQAIMPNIQQQRYATEYQRNLFLNGADPGGIITVPNSLDETEFDELIDRWRESHRGVARAGHVGVLENGATWQSGSHSNRDLEYGNLRMTNRDEIREPWRMHKAMMGTSDDVNRANAQTAEEIFTGWQAIPRLNRRRDTLNSKLLVKFGMTAQGVEFDYDDPSPENAEAAADELAKKAAAFAELVGAGMDPHDALEIVGLPDAAMASENSAQALPGQATPGQGVITPGNRERIELIAGKDTAGKVYQQMAEDFPAEAIAWMHHATWTGPVAVPLDHIDPYLQTMNGVDPDKVQAFTDRRQKGKKLKPVILVKTPSNAKLLLVDGHHRYLAEAELDEPVRAYVGTVNADHGAWETMHDYERQGTPAQRAEQLTVGNSATLSKGQVHYRDASRAGRSCGTCAMFRAPASCSLVKGVIRPDGVCDRWARDDNGTDEMAALLRHVLTDGYVPVQTAGRQ